LMFIGFGLGAHFGLPFGLLADDRLANIFAGSVPICVFGRN
jgi:hypothetical protein